MIHDFNHNFYLTFSRYQLPCAFCIEEELLLAGPCSFPLLSMALLKPSFTTLLTYLIWLLYLLQHKYIYLYIHSLTLHRLRACIMKAWKRIAAESHVEEGVLVDLVVFAQFKLRHVTRGLCRITILWWLQWNWFQIVEPQVCAEPRKRGANFQFSRQPMRINLPSKGGEVGTWNRTERTGLFFYGKFNRNRIRIQIYNSPWGRDNMREAGPEFITNHGAIKKGSAPNSNKTTFEKISLFQSLFYVMFLSLERVFVSDHPACLWSSGVSAAGHFFFLPF